MTASLTASCSTARRDTAGQERYASLAPLYYRGASAAAVVFDVTSPESFAKAQHWVKELQKNAGGSISACCVSRYAFYPSLTRLAHS